MRCQPGRYVGLNRYDDEKMGLDVFINQTFPAQ